MNVVKLFQPRVHDKAELSIADFEDRLELKLVNKVTGKTSEKPYYKLDTGMDMGEAMKIDFIVSHMHNAIGLDLWED